MKKKNRNPVRTALVRTDLQSPVRTDLQSVRPRPRGFVIRTSIVVPPVRTDLQSVRLVYADLQSACYSLHFPFSILNLATIGRRYLRHFGAFHFPVDACFTFNNFDRIGRNHSNTADIIRKRDTDGIVAKIIST